jgi:flavin-dependent dehydrogenase
MNGDWDAVVVGAGPAGSIAARELARRGRSVLLLDKATFPRPKVCGCCLNEAALAALRSMGLGDLPARCGAVPLSGVKLAAGGRTADVRLPGGVALSREAFDAALVREAVAAGATFVSGVTVQRGELAPRVLILANGLNSQLVPDRPRAARNSRIGAGVIADGAPAFYEPGRIFMAVGRGGYVGLVRLEDGRLDIAAAFDTRFVRETSGLGFAACAVLSEAGFPPIANLEDLPWRGTPALTRTAPRVAGERWFAIGDAAGYVEPFTGEGMAWAVASGAAVAPIAAREWTPASARDWSRVHGRLIRRRQGVCRVVARVLRSPTLSRLAVCALWIAPVLSRPVVGALNRPVPVTEPRA